MSSANLLTLTALGVGAHKSNLRRIGIRYSRHIFGSFFGVVSTSVLLLCTNKFSMSRKTSLCCLSWSAGDILARLAASDSTLIRFERHKFQIDCLGLRQSSLSRCQLVVTMSFNNFAQPNADGGWRRT